MATLRQVQVTFDCHDPRAVSRFWSEALGYVIPAPPGMELPDGADPFEAWDAFLERVGVPREEWTSRSAIEDPTGQGPRIFFQRVPEDKVVKNRLHLDVRAAPGLSDDARMDALEAECTRLVALGATRLHRLEGNAMDQGIIVMQDPEGNEFCLD